MADKHKIGTDEDGIPNCDCDGPGGDDPYTNCGDHCECCDGKEIPTDTKLRKRIREELGGMTSDPDVMRKEYGHVPGMKEDISRDEIVEILNEIYELQLEKAPAIAQRRLDELFEKVGIGYWSYPSPQDRIKEELSLLQEKDEGCCCKYKLTTTGFECVGKKKKSCCDTFTGGEIPLPPPLQEGRLTEKKDKMCCVCIKVIESWGNVLKWSCCGWKKCSEVPEEYRITKDDI